MLQRFLVLSVIGITLSSFCGDSTIPFSFEALPNGQPVLGCARPTCFGWNRYGFPASNTANFYRINRRPDGFFRKDRVSIPAFYPHDSRNSQPQKATCEPSYQSLSCEEENEWVAGIAPLLNVSAFPLVLQCCSFEPLSLSSNRGIATVHPGQIVVGGEVMNNDKQFAFDYISDISKTINTNGTVSYDVNIRRFPCPAIPEHPQGQLPDSSANNKPFSKLGSIEKNTPVLQDSQNAIFQAQTLSSNPIPFVADNERILYPSSAVESKNDITGPFEDNMNLEEITSLSDTEVDSKILPSVLLQQNQKSLQKLSQQPMYHIPAQNYDVYNSQFGKSSVQTYSTASEYAVPPPVKATYYPSAAIAAPSFSNGGVGGYSNGYYCFAADTKVRLINGTEKKMDQLEVGDWVQTMVGTNVQFVPVTFWLHRMPMQKADFQRIELNDGSVLKMTAKHYIYKTKCNGERGEFVMHHISKEAVFAENIQEGDCLYRVYEDNTVITSRVEKVSKIQEIGIYSPMTANGKIIVNGIYASCHSIIKNHSLQNSFFTYVDAFSKLYSTIFGVQSEVTNLPMGIETVLAILELVAPKNLVML